MAVVPASRPATFSVMRPCLWTLLFSEPAMHRQASMIVGGDHTMVLKN